MPTILSDPTVAVLTLVIDPGGTSLTLQDPPTGWRLMEFDAPAPDLDSQWASSVDTEGELRAGWRYTNRTITAKVLINQSTHALLEAAENQLGAKIAKLQREGGELEVGYPSEEKITFDVIEANLRRTYTPTHVARRLAEYELRFVCLPLSLGAEVDLGDNVETTLPVLIFTEASVLGDVDALGRLVIDNDDATNDQWWVIWGIESKNYNAATAATTSALFLEAEGRTAMGGSAAAAGPSGASGAGSNVMRNTALTTTYQAILSTQATGAGAHLSHVGQFRIFARVQTPTTNTGSVSVALEWGEGDFRRYTRNEATVIDSSWEGSWRDLDLGFVSLTKAVAGTQRWEGRIIAKSTVLGDDIDIDFLFLIPVGEGSGEIKAVSRVVTPTAFTARDEFDQTSGALNAKTLPVGGTWTTSGATTDFSVTGSTTFKVIRTTTSDTGPRYAIAGTTAFTDVEASIDYTGGFTP